MSPGDLKKLADGERRRYGGRSDKRRDDREDRHLCRHLGEDRRRHDRRGDLADRAVTTAKIADSAVTSVKIADELIINVTSTPPPPSTMSKLSGVVATATVREPAVVGGGGPQALSPQATAAYGFRVGDDHHDGHRGRVGLQHGHSVCDGGKTVHVPRGCHRIVGSGTGGCPCSGVPAAPAPGGLVSSQVLEGGCDGHPVAEHRRPPGGQRHLQHLLQRRVHRRHGHVRQVRHLGGCRRRGSLPGIGIKGTPTPCPWCRAPTWATSSRRTWRRAPHLSSTDGFHIRQATTPPHPDTAQYYQGTRSLKMVSLGAGSLYLTHGGITTNGTIPVTAGCAVHVLRGPCPTASPSWVSAHLLVCGGRHADIQRRRTYLRAVADVAAVRGDRDGTANAVTASVMFIGYSIVLGDTLWTDAWSLNTGGGGSGAAQACPCREHMTHLVLPRNEVGNLPTAAQASFEDRGTGNSYFSVVYGTLANSSARPRTAEVPCRDVHGRLRQSHRGDRADGGNRAADRRKYYTGAGRGPGSDQASGSSPRSCTPTLRAVPPPPSPRAPHRPSPTPGGRLSP